jgi:hypothetical protein
MAGKCHIWVCMVETDTKNNLVREREKVTKKEHTNVQE